MTSQKELQEYVEEVGAGFSVDVDTGDFRWSVVRLPTTKFLKIMSRKEWLAWLREERAHADDPDYYVTLERAWLADPGAFDPVVVIETCGGDLDIGDGWHRAAIAVKSKLRSVRAVFGRERC